MWTVSIPIPLQNEPEQLCFALVNPTGDNIFLLDFAQN